MNKSPNAVVQDDWEGRREKVKPILKALYKEFSEHETCNYEFGCIVESNTLWEELNRILEAEKAASYQQGVRETVDKLLDELCGTDGLGDYYCKSYATDEIEDLLDSLSPTNKEEK